MCIENFEALFFDTEDNHTWSDLTVNKELSPFKDAKVSLERLAKIGIYGDEEKMKKVAYNIFTAALKTMHN